MLLSRATEGVATAVDGLAAAAATAASTGVLLTARRSSSRANSRSGRMTGEWSVGPVPSPSPHSQILA